MSIEVREKKRFYYALFFPVIICFLVLIVFVFEQVMGLDFGGGGIAPRQPLSLFNIFTMPFIHADWGHLFNNLVSFLVLSVALFYFYSEIADKVLFWSLVVSGLLLWIIGRDAVHIGLSGMVYAVSFFLTFSGIIRKHIPLIAIALVVVFLYGNNVWHLFPWQQFDPVSWEGHLAGAIAGVALAFVYRKEGPQKPQPQWEDEDEYEDDESAYWNDKVDEEQDDMRREA